MSATFDAWLSSRAARGDAAAFGRLIATHGRTLRNVAASFDAPDTTVDDLAQIVAVKLWAELQRGAYNPHRASFEHYLSTVAYQALRDDRQRRRAQGRWAAESPLSLDMEQAGDLDTWVTPSWHLGADPASVVLERERLRLAWQELSEAHQRNLNRWLAADGGNRPNGLTRSQVTCAGTARALGRQALATLT